jgi:cullin-associated NEDD8-dissociated protein 1
VNIFKHLNENNKLILCLGLEQFVEPLRSACTLKVKPNSVKQEYEKQDELKRSALRAVAALLQIPKAGKF